jgi:copper chaperone CopZ
LLLLEVVGERRIDCERCESRIGDGLRRLHGVQKVEASADTQRISVTIDPARVTPDRVRGELAELGYQVA